MAQETADPFTTDQLRGLIAKLGQFSGRVRERGGQYAQRGRVGPLTFDTGRVAANVRGSSLYHTRWEWDEDDGYWVPDCDCPVGPYCKHAYAVACYILIEGRAQERLTDRRLERLLPRYVSMGAPLSPQSPGRSAPAVPRRPTTLLERLRLARDAWARQHVLADLIPADVGRTLNLYLSPFPTILQEPDPDLLCWRLAQELPKRAGGWLPKMLEPYRERPDLAARITERERAVLADELVRWATQQRLTPQRRLRLVLTLAVDSSGDAYVAGEPRLTTPRLNDAPRSILQLQQLRSEARRSAGLLPPDEVALLEWVVDHNVAGMRGYAYDTTATRRLTGSELKAIVARFADSPAVTWGAENASDLVTRGGIAPGDRVRLNPVPARLLPTCVPRGDTAWIDFLLLWPDSGQRPLSEVVYLGGVADSLSTQPSFVLVDGAFSRVIEEPPPSLLRRCRAVGGLPLAASERRPMLERLAASFPHLHDTLAAHTTFHQVRPLFGLDLRDDDWLQIRVFAHATSESWTPGTLVPPGTILYELAPDRRWVRDIVTDAEHGSAASHLPLEADATSEAVTATPALVSATDDGTVWLEAPDPVCVEPAIRWLAALPAGEGEKSRPGGRQPTWADRDVGWWMPASRKGMEALAEAWDRRPRGVAFFATERLHRLLTTDCVTPVLRVEASGLDWFSVSTEWASEGLRLSDADLAKLRAATTRFVKLSSGWVRRDVAASHDETAAALGDLGIEVGQGEQRLTIWQLAGAKAESLQLLERLAGDAEAVAAAQRLREHVAAFTGVPHVPPPADLAAALRPYQQCGLDVLAYTSSLGIGTVLADDMGLGKTIQALAWLQHLQHQEPNGGPSLVVCPASVVHNWAREAERFVPDVRVLLLTRGNARQNLRQEIPHHDLIVTNFALLRRDLAYWRTLEWRAVIIDEAQNIKNPDAAVTHAAQTLRARHRLALTGTPLENRALDLWSIMSFVNPGYLGSRAQFEARFDRLDAPPHARTLLAAKLRPVLLRRTKLEVAPELPDRIEERRDCELTKEQRHLYLAELRRSRALVEQLSTEPGGIKQNKIHILAALTRLRQICCHPALAGGKVSLGSGKFDALFELLDPLLAEGHKVLLFSQFVECLKLLKSEMRRRGIVSHVLTGETTKRKEVVDAFQHDSQPCVFLISLKAGGTGLNLTAASYVVLFDPWWNPAVEAQAIDRAHRIGQDRTVIAYRLLSVGTIEEKIWELQQRKAALARDILGEGGFARALNRDDLEYLLADQQP